MATVDRPRRKQPKDSSSPAPVKKKSRAFRYGCLLMLLLMAVAVYFAPPIIGSTPLGNWLLASVLNVDGSITLGSASLGWFSPVEVENLEIRDAAGDPLLEVESLSSEKPLIGILLDVADLGRLHVVRPVLHVVADEKSSNLEQVLGPLLSSSRGSRLAAQLEVTEGTIVVDDTVADRQFRLEDVSLDCTLADASGGITLVASGRLPDARQPGNFKVDFRAGGSDNAEFSLASGKIECQANALPLELLVPLLRRKVVGAQLTGRLSTRLGGAWGEMAEGGETSVRGESLITDLDFSASSLGPDHIRLARVEMPCHIVQKDELVEVEQLALQCELGQVSLSGSAKMRDFSATGKLTALVREGYQLKGHVDLAHLATLLPTTLRIKEGTEITDGQVEVALTSRPQTDGGKWTGRVDASHLSANAKGRAIVWENPLAIQFDAHETPRGLVVERIQCTSEFLQIDATGSLDDLNASADFDLSRLIAELKQFVDLSDMQLAGHGQSQWVWKRVDTDRFTASAEFQVNGFQWTTNKARAWKEDNLVAKLEISGQLVERAVKRIEKATLTVASGPERLEVELREALGDPFTAVWPVALSWQGQLAHWAPRIESCLNLGALDLAGQGTVEALVRGSTKAIEVEQCKADFTQFMVRGHGAFVHEPTASAVFQGKWDRDANRVELPQAKLTAGASVAVVNGAVLQSTDTGWALDGTTQIAAELAQLYRWRHDPNTPAVLQVSGRVTGDGTLKHAAGVTTGQFDGAADQLQVSEYAKTQGSKTPAWQEPHLTLAARGAYQHDNEQLQVEKLRVVSNALRCDAKGVVAMAPGGGDIDLKGTVQYDWQQLSALLRPFVGQGVQIAGQQTREFSVHGQLTGALTSAESWHGVNGEAAVGWTGMNVYGLNVGRGDIVATLANGQVRTQPIDVEISEGRLSMSPLVQLSPAPAELLLSRGPLLTNVHLTPELCSQGLRFVAPILSGAAVADGTFSVSLEGGRLPLSDLAAGDIGGRMGMRANVKPGPVAREFVVLIKELTTILGRGKLVPLDDQAASLLSIDDNDIEFRLVERRIYHRNLQFVIGTTPITTHGSVGIDESLAIIAEVPVQAKLFGIDLSLGTLEGQTLQIPIGGTLSKPKFDPRAMQHLAGQMLENTARGVLIDGVGKQLEGVGKQLERFLPSQQ